MALNTARSHPSNQSILAHLPEPVRDTFTDAQLQALRQSFTLIGRQPHRLDIRYSLPWPGKGFYVVLLAGPERRAQPRDSAPSKPLTRPLLLLLSILLGSATVFGLVRLRDRYGAAANRLTNPAAIHPTTVPFKQNPQDCKASGRQWRQGRCFDYEHDPNF